MISSQLTKNLLQSYNNWVDCREIVGQNQLQNVVNHPPSTVAGQYQDLPSMLGNSFGGSIKFNGQRGQEQFPDFFYIRKTKKKVSKAHY